jgi:predicted DNA-binding transcriptional regulator AlpA
MARKRPSNAAVCPLLRIEEAAERIGCEPTLLWDLLHRGDLPGMVRLDRYYVEAGRLEDVLEVLTRPNGIVRC